MHSLECVLDLRSGGPEFDYHPSQILLILFSTQLLWFISFALLATSVTISLLQRPDSGFYAQWAMQCICINAKKSINY